VACGFLTARTRKGGHVRGSTVELAQAIIGNGARHMTDNPRRRERVRILAFVGYFLPGHKSGGPVQSLRLLAEHLADDAEFTIVCRDRDFGDSQPYPPPYCGDFATPTWRVIYTRPGLARLTALWRALRDNQFDVIYLNSLFSREFSMLPMVVKALLRVRTPVLLAPRGELSPGALLIRGLRKRLYLALARLLGVYRQVNWHATSARELEHICKHFPDAAVRQAGILTAREFAPPAADRPHRSSRDDSEPLQAVFLSRVTPMKNLALVLEALRHAERPIHLSVAGVIDDPKYFQLCQQKAASLPAHCRVTYLGHLSLPDVAALLGRSDVFLLPTRGENHGHAILEALASGVPVIISDQTPWSSVSDLGGGWVCEISTPAPFCRALKEFSRLSARERAAFGVRARNAFETLVDNVAIAAENRRMFAQLQSLSLRTIGGPPRV